MSIVENILKERELKNEKRVAWIRFFALCPMTIVDVLAYFNIVQLTEFPPNLFTIILDLIFVFSGTFVLILLLKNKFPDYLTYYVITFDYSFVMLSIFFDPTVSKDPSMIGWVALVGPLFFYLINLLRYSKKATIFSAILSVILYLSCIIYFKVYNRGDIVPMFIVLIIMLLIGYSITVTNKEMMIEANTKKMMERYLAPQLIDELYQKHASLEPGGKNQKVTILFSDIRSFTSISESMSPSDVVSFLNDYLSLMTDVIFHHKGTIDKFIGDAIMTIFGAPLPGKEDALRSVQAAIAMNKALKKFNETHRELVKPLEIGIGIHTGEVIIGNIGSDKRLDYTVIGDSVNLSSRIQDLTKFYKCPILISESTKNELNLESVVDSFITREVDKVIVKGKSVGIKIFEIMYFETNLESEKKLKIKNNFEEGLNLYSQMKFEDAINSFQKNISDPLSFLYKERCEYLKKNNPGKNWDGTFLMTNK